MSTPKFIKNPTPVPIISMDVMARLETIFNDKQWSIDRNSQISLYDRYCNTLMKFTEEEQQLLLELTERFLKIDLNDYVGYFENLLNDIQNDNPGSPLILVPCLPEKEVGKTKSASVALYIMKSTHYNHAVKCGIEPNDIKNVLPVINQNTIIVLVDDFIGTGETALKAISYAQSILPQDFPLQNIKVMSIVTMESGKAAIENIGVKVYSHYTNKKGITDYYTGDKLLQATGLMNSIESKLKKLKPEFRFGYGLSEALVCMSRCPNNTFPVYWLGKNTAPYER